MSSSKNQRYEFLSLFKRVLAVMMDGTWKLDYEMIYLCGILSDLVHNVPKNYSKTGRVWQEDEFAAIETTLNSREYKPIFLSNAIYISYIFNAELSGNILRNNRNFVLKKVALDVDTTKHPEPDIVIPSLLLECFADTMLMIRARMLSSEILTNNPQVLCRLFFVSHDDLIVYLRMVNSWLCMLDAMIDDILRGFPLDMNWEISQFITMCPPHLHRDFLFILHYPSKNNENQ